MFRTTGPGRVEIDSKYTSPGIIKALLYNFDFDDMQSAALKAEHAKFLVDRVIPLLEGDRGHIWMQGSASRIGAAAYNKTLSRARVNRVAGFLTANQVARRQMQLDAVGAELTAGHALDDEHDRGVALVVLPKAKVDPPPPRPVPPKPKTSRTFKLSMLMGLSAGKALRYAKYLKGKVGAGVAVDGLFFQMWDTTNNLACIYAYVGAGFGVGLMLPWPHSGTMHGPWNPFTTSAEISSAQFDGLARFTTAGTAKWTVNWIHLLGTPRGVDSVYMMIDTGTTLGGGASFTGGKFILLEGPGPFSGP